MFTDMYQMASLRQLQMAPAWLIEANQVLALSSAELQSLVQKELEENPALELEEHSFCPTCGCAFQGARCPYCLALTPFSLPQADGEISLNEPGSWLPEAERHGGEGDEFDPTLLLAEKMSLAEHLRLVLQEMLPQDDTVIIGCLVGSLDEDGYLHTTVQEAAQLCEVAVERVERVLEVLQAQEPIGVGARNVRECLLIQLRFLEGQGVHQPHAHQIIDRYLSDFAEHKYHQIAKELKIGVRQVREVHAFIKHTLHPFPASGYLGADVSAASGLARPIQPDVVITRKPDPEDRSYEIEVVEARRFSLQVSPSYTEAARTLAVRHMSEEAERRQIYEYLKRSKLFIANVRRRWQTLHQITCCLVKAQRDFLEHGLSALRPLTREQLAEELGLHASTVSRATAAKYVMVPNKQVIPFSTFFTANLGLKEALKHAVRAEERPLSDQKLAEMLQAQGWQVARRTVAKYREEMKIPPSSAR